MKKSFPFFKMSGAGNDFVLLSEETARRLADGRGLAGLARRLADRREGVGADGVLIAGPAPRGARAAYFNADGSRAFCGNGSRCAAWWAYREGLTGGKKEFLLETDSGPLAAEIRGPGRAAIAMPRPLSFRPDLDLELPGGRRSIHFIKTGVPHAVLPVSDIKDAPVSELGPLLRRHRAFGAAGANADFALFAKGGVRLRTFERGVEAETRACGTGAAAAALVGFWMGLCRPPVPVWTAGGSLLRVDFTPPARGRDPRKVGDLRLEGPARLVFEGRFAP